MTSALATSHHFFGQRDPLSVEHDGRPLRLVVLDQLGHEEIREHVALFHLVADVDNPFVDVSVHLRIDRRALVALDKARLPDNPDDLPDLRLDQPHGRRVSDTLVWSFRGLRGPAARRSESLTGVGQQGTMNYRPDQSSRQVIRQIVAERYGTSPHCLRPLCHRGYFHLCAVARSDISPTITCSVPSIGTQGFRRLPPRQRAGPRRLVTSIHSPSLTPVSHVGSHRTARSRSAQ